MKVGELKKRLAGLDDELLVVVQRYADEPRYSLLAGTETLSLVYLPWHPEGPEEDEVRYTELTSALEKQGLGEEVVAGPGEGGAASSSGRGTKQEERVGGGCGVPRG